MSQKLPRSELLYTKSKPIDHLNISDSISLMANEQKKAAIDVLNASQSIEQAIYEIYEHLTINLKGRLIYVGAGTSGRIGVQDGVELFPTFSWPKDRLDFIIAGGNKAITNSVENAEDDILAARESIKKKAINEQDVVIGLAASGNTAFTCEVMKEAEKLGALTIAISNNPKGKILSFGKVQIILDTREEVILGSTRLKAGTAQKICLNLISSLIMVKMGRVQNGKMSHMVPTNLKLKARKSRMDKKI